MNPMPPPQQPNRDLQHLKLLGILHYVQSGFAILGMAFLALHYLIMSTVLDMAAKDPKFQQHD